MKNLRRFTSFGFAAIVACAVSMATAQEPQAGLKFDFGSGPVRAGFTRVGSSALYSDATGFGFESAAAAGQQMMFSVKLPEGNYNVTVTLGDSTASTTTIEAESGRLMIERLQVPAGQTVQRTFTTNVRGSHLPKLPLNATGREEVSLDMFDRANQHDWDDRLTVEVIGSTASLRSIEVAPAPAATTVFLAGDSTVTDRDSGGDVSWGQLLPRFLNAGVSVANHAQSGETLKSFANSLRLDKILSQMKKGDYLFIQFGHNDSKASWPQTYVEAETTYKAYLKVYIAEARLRGATPVLVTPMDRGDRTTGAPQHGHGGYVPAMREVAKEESVALIDLYAMSEALYEHAGADAPKILADGTHSTAFGGYEFAKCVVMGIRQNRLGLASEIVEDFKDFDPTHPDSAAALSLDGLFRSGESKRGAAMAANPGSGPI